MPGVNIIGEPGTQAIAFTQVFDAPRELVFKAYTEIRSCCRNGSGRSA